MNTNCFLSNVFSNKTFVFYILSTSLIFVWLKVISQMRYMKSDGFFGHKKREFWIFLQIQPFMVIRIHDIYSHTYSLGLYILYREKCSSSLIWDKNYRNRCCIQGSEVAIKKWKMRITRNKLCKLWIHIEEIALR